MKLKHTCLILIDRMANPVHPLPARCPRRAPAGQTSLQRARLADRGEKPATSSAARRRQGKRKGSDGRSVGVGDAKRAEADWPIETHPTRTAAIGVPTNPPACRATHACHCRTPAIIHVLHKSTPFQIQTFPPLPPLPSPHTSEKRQALPPPPPTFPLSLGSQASPMAAYPPPPPSCSIAQCCCCC